MSDKIFVHYPPCVSKRLEKEFDALLRAHHTMYCFRDRVEIYGTAHAIKQLQVIERFREKTSIGSYMLYALLFVLTKLSLPPSLCAMKKRPLFKEDMFKLRYHTRELDDCATGIFVPHNDGMWPYDMWRNAKRLLAQAKPVWVITGNEETGWNIASLNEAPARNKRLSRKQTIVRVGEYSEPFDTRGHPVIKLFAEVFDKKKD